MLSVPAGHGHIRPAEALAAAAAGRSDLRCEHRDLLRLASPLGARCYAAIHRRLMDRHPSTLARIYRDLEHRYARPGGADTSRWVRLAGGRRLARALVAAAPDDIVVTHCLGGELVSRLLRQGRLRSRLWVVENDFSYHSWWRHPGVAGYFVPSREAAAGLVRHGVPADRVHLSGIPVRPGFAHPPSRAAAATGLGLDPDRFTVTLISGGGAIGDLDNLAGTLLGHDSGLQLVVLAGTDRHLLRRLQRHREAAAGRLVVLGLTDRVPDAMAVADVVVTKPGGSTVAELLALGRAMILVRPQPALEDHNAAWLLERDAALLALDREALRHRLELLRDPHRRATLAANARALGRPDAADEILGVITRDGTR